MNYPPFPQREQAAQPEKPAVTVPKGREDYPDDGCPECGYVPQDARDAAKHSVGHYGEYPLPNQAHQNIVARQRQAALNGWEIPTR